jgi:hypothetical protein
MFWRRKPVDTKPQYLKPDGTMAYRVRVKTAKRGEIVEIRFTKSGDVSSIEGGGYFVRKHIVGPNSFDRATLEIGFGSNYSNPTVTVDGGEAIPVSEWVDG